MNIVVNGGTRGIGREIVLNLSLNADNKIIVMGRNEKSLKNLSSSSGNILGIKFDISSMEADYKSLLSAIKDHISSVDILINNAGMLVSKVFTETNETEARLMMETNFFGPALVIRNLKTIMSPGAHIVNITSMGGFQGSVKFRGLSYYSASKAAIACLSECLANEFTDSLISVNCLALGAVQTEMLEEAFPGYKAPVTAKEMAGFISYFALNGHKFFNGKTLPVAVSTP
jgi:NAD(P)-dependent dehydrogenase (short-subunit alcohol dehydrogenase family)